MRQLPDYPWRNLQYQTIPSFCSDGDGDFQARFLRANTVPLPAQNFALDLAPTPFAVAVAVGEAVVGRNAKMFIPCQQGSTIRQAPQEVVCAPQQHQRQTAVARFVVRTADGAIEPRLGVKCMIIANDAFLKNWAWLGRSLQYSLISL